MPTELKPKMVSTYVASRYMDIGDGVRSPGELVPEAATWLRVESHVNCGYLKEVKVSHETFVNAVEQYCPELAPQLVGKTRGQKNG